MSTKPKPIVELERNNPTTTSLAIAEGVGRSHQSVMKIIDKHLSDIEEVGGISRFEISKKRGTQGKETRYAILNEEHTAYLFTLMRNTPVVIEFKKKLIKEFFRMKKTLMKIASQKQNTEWLEARSKSKAIRHDATDTIKLFVQYATEQGSTSAARYYISLTKMEYRALFLLEQHFPNLRDVLNARQLGIIVIADQVVEKALVDGMRMGLHYKEIYKLAKNRVLAFADVIGVSPVQDLFPKSLNDDQHAELEVAA